MPGPGNTPWENLARDTLSPGPPSRGRLTGELLGTQQKADSDRSCVDRILFSTPSRVTGFVQRNSRQPHSPVDSGLRFTGIIFPDKWRSVLLTFTFVVVAANLLVLLGLVLFLGVVLGVLVVLGGLSVHLGGLWLVVVVRRSRVLVRRRHHQNRRRMLRTLMSRRHHQARQQHRPRPRRNRTTAKTS